MVQLSHPYMTTGKTIALTRQNFVGKVMSLLFNTLSRFVIAFLPKSKRLLIVPRAHEIIQTSQQVNPDYPASSISYPWKLQ